VVAAGLGWLVLLKYLEQGRKALPFTIVLFGIMGLVLLAFDQTRVVAIRLLSAALRVLAAGL
jgi:hypothetical protein